MYSFVIKIAIDNERAMLEDIIIPTLWFVIAKLLESIVEADPIKNSVIINKTFFLFKDSYIFPESSLSTLSDFSVFSWSCFSVLNFFYFIIFGW